IFLGLAGAADMMRRVFRSVVWSQTAPDSLRGRLAGLAQISYTSGPALGNPEGGLVASPVRLRVSRLWGGRLCGLRGRLVDVALPQNAPSRHISLPFIVKAWKRALEPECLVLVARDVSGRCWDYADGGKQVKNPRRWLSSQLRGLRMQGMIDFPGVAGREKR